MYGLVLEITSYSPSYGVLAFIVLQLANELFGVTVEPASNEHTWHPDVKFFSLKRDGRQKAYFYLDPYSRPAGVHLCMHTHARTCTGWTWLIALSVLNAAVQQVHWCSPCFSLFASFFERGCAKGKSTAVVIQRSEFPVRLQVRLWIESVKFP